MSFIPADQYFNEINPAGRQLRPGNAYGPDLIRELFDENEAHNGVPHPSTDDLIKVIKSLVYSSCCLSNINKPWKDNNYGRAASALAWTLPTDHELYPLNGGIWGGYDDEQLELYKVQNPASNPNGVKPGEISILSSYNSLTGEYASNELITAELIYEENKCDISIFLNGKDLTKQINTGKIEINSESWTGIKDDS